MLSTEAPDIVQTAEQYLPTAIAPDTPDSRSPNQFLLPLTARINAKGHLEIGGCDVVDLTRHYGSPLYILDEYTLRQACRQYRDTFRQQYPGASQVIFACKAWSCLAVCAIASGEGLGMDVVSGGELHTALQAGVDPNTIYFHGNNKSEAELAYAAEVGCTVIVDNWWELKTLAEVGAKQPAPVRIMLRLTPGIECHTHEYIRTGQLDSKFGFDPSQFPTLLQFLSQQTSLNCVGLHAHIGSQIFELQPHQDLAEVLITWMRQAHEAGLNLTELNVGGGLGIRYTEADDPPSILDWVTVVSQAVVRACQSQGVPLPKLICEPGRSLVGSACVTAYRVGSQKVIPGVRTYVAVDGGMSDNPRPITYQSSYLAVVANRMTEALAEPVTIAGKHCESGDIVIPSIRLPATIAGDVVIVMATGAYNYSMASNYNRLPRPAAVVVSEDNAQMILRRETYADLIRQDCLPERLMNHG